MSNFRSPVVRTLLLAAAGAAALLPGVAAAVTMVAALLGWLASRPERRTVAAVLPALAVAAACLIVAQGRQGSSSDADLRRAQTAFAALDGEITEALAAARRALSSPPSQADGRARAFDELQRLVDSRSRGAGALEPSWMLFDPDGEPAAWAGRGLVHEIRGDALPLAGRVVVSGFTATTFLSVEALDESRRPWRVGAGVSLPSDRLPGEGDPGRCRWAALPDDSRQLAGAPVVVAGDLRLLVDCEPEQRELARLPYRRAALLLAALGLALAALSSLASAEPRWWPLPALVAVALGAAGADLAWPVGGLAGVGVLLLWPRRGLAERRRGNPFLEITFGLVTAVLLLAAALLLQGLLGPVDLGSGFGGGSGRAALRLAFFAAALGLLWAQRARPAESGAGKWGASSLAVLAAGAALHGWSLVGVALLVGGSWLAAAWARRGGWCEGGFGRVMGCGLAALLAALAWESAYHRALEARLAEVVESDLAPPSPDDVGRFRATAQGFFAEQPLESLTLADPERLEPEDLAFALWRRSPLAMRGRLSRVTVGPPGEPLSRFSYGLIGADERVSQIPERAEERLPGWRDPAIGGTGVVTLGGGPWAEVTFEARLQPGFRDPEPLVGSLAEGLLRRQESAAWVPPDLPAGTRVGFYDVDGSVLVPPWSGASDLSVDPLPARVRLPHGWATTFAAASADGWRVVFLPVPTPLQGLERTAVHAAMPLVVLALAALAWWLVSLVGGGRGGAVRAGWRSYARRLVLSYTLLLIVPVVLVNVLILRVFAERLEAERLAAGRTALESAQQILGDYVLSLEPGFGIDTAVGDDVLRWLAGVVDHEVNLYWESRLSASSRRELFSAGLLPPRIPGDVFSRVALRGATVASRRTRAGDVAYEEFYGPIGLPEPSPTLFVSIPLLAQEIATAEEMASIRRRILLSAAAVAILLAALGRRIGGSLTRPLLQIVDGTQSIAAGAPSIDVEVTDIEFVTLVDAINDMAGRIAEARAALLHEKQLVDQMIDNVNAGVVSIDRRGKVLLLNAKASELLGLEAGNSVLEGVKRRPELAPVAEFLSSAPRRPMQETVRLPGDGEEETEWTIVWVPLAGEGEPAALLVLEDVTEVLRGQRLAAWAEMARMIAHEVKNPLTPIRLSTEHLREVGRSGKGDLDQALEQCTANILVQVEELQEIVADFSVYSRIPQIERQPGDLADFVEGIVDGYRHGSKRIGFEKTGGPWRTSFDAKLLRRALRNLIENALRATEEGGEVRVEVRSAPSGFEIRVADTGPGVAQQLLARMFEPYFSTEDSGTGLGLPIARRIVEEHGGFIVARNRAGGGLEVVMTLPKEPAAEDTSA